MDFPGRRGHQSLFYCLVGWPSKSGSQGSDVGMLEGEEERGETQPRPWEDLPISTKESAAGENEELLYNGEGSLKNEKGS